MPGEIGQHGAGMDLVPLQVHRHPRGAVKVGAVAPPPAGAEVLGNVHRGGGRGAGNGDDLPNGITTT